MLGGVVGGVVVLIVVALIAIFFMRRRKYTRANKERPALFHDNDDEDSPSERRDNLPQYYEPEPFTLPEPTDAGGSTRPSTDRRHSQLTYMTDLNHNGRAATPDGGTVITGSSRKSPMPPALRPVNFVQHEDAGPSGVQAAEGEEAETVELPPAYTNFRK